MYLESGHVTYGMTPSTILTALRFSLLSEDRQSNCFSASVTVEARSIESCDLHIAGSCTSLFMYEKQAYCSKVGPYDGIPTST
jgi:hypothetical protein